MCGLIQLDLDYAQNSESASVKLLNQYIVVVRRNRTGANALKQNIQINILFYYII